MAARIAGCDPIIAVDRLTSRLALARELDATHTRESRGAETLAEIRLLAWPRLRQAVELTGRKERSCGTLG
jgi:aryl-alcohol dehydrogenase